MAVVDASVLANALVSASPASEAARTALHGHERLAAPELVDVETMSVLRKLWLRARLSDETFGEALSALRSMPIDRLPGTDLLPRVFELRHSVNAYDAMYIALAEGLGEPLLTADRRLATAHGPTCPFELIE